MSCQVTHFGLLTNGAFSSCLRREVVGGGGAPALNMIRQDDDEPKLYVKIKDVDYKTKGKDTDLVVIIKEVKE